MEVVGAPSGMRTLLAVTMLVGITTMFAAPTGTATTAVRCDFDGDGKADLAVGVPGENGRPGHPAGWLPAASA